MTEIFKWKNVVGITILPPLPTPQNISQPEPWITVHQKSKNKSNKTQLTE